MWLEASAHCAGNVEDMLEGCEFLLELSSIEAESCCVLHSSQLEVKYCLTLLLGRW